jgi:hypothetical protein
MTKLKLLLATAALCGGLGMTTASAMPIANLPNVLATDVESVRWVCGPYRCWWRPGPYYRRPYWGYRRWGYRRWGY